jgi:excisionase family DNA binding protein
MPRKNQRKQDRDLMTARQVADASGLGLQTVYRMFKSGELPAFRTGKWYRMTRAAYERWLTRNGKTAA